MISDVGRRIRATYGTDLAAGLTTAAKVVDASDPTPSSTIYCYTKVGLPLGRKLESHIFVVGLLAPDHAVDDTG